MIDKLRVEKAASDVNSQGGSASSTTLTVRGSGASRSNPCTELGAVEPRKAEIGAKVGQRNLSVTADRYTHAMLEYGEIDRAKLLGRVRTTHTPMHTPSTENSAFAEAF